MKLKNLHYGWSMVAIATCILATYSLVLFSRGTFLMPIITEFNWERGALSGAFSIFLLVGGLLAILAGRLCDKYGPRPLLTLAGLTIGTACLLMTQVSSLWQIYLIWAIFMGIGDSFCFIPILSTIPRWFTKRRGIAVGIIAASVGLGGMISPILAQWLISASGWRQAFLILGIINLIIIAPIAQFMKHSPQRIGLRPYGEDEPLEDEQSLASATDGLSLAQAIKTTRFWLFASLLFCFFFLFQVIIVHIVPYAIDNGISAIVAASILSIVIGTSIVSRLGIGFISDRIGGRLTLTGCLSVAALALVWLLFAKGTGGFYLFAVIFGIGSGGIMPLESVVMVELFGLKSLGSIFGATLLFGYIGMALGPILAGNIFDITRSYSLAFLICVALAALSVLLGLILLRYKAKKG